MLFFLIDVYLLEKYSIRLVLETYSTYLSIKVHIFREGHKILRNLHLTFDYSTQNFVVEYVSNTKRMLYFSNR